MKEFADKFEMMVKIGKKECADNQKMCCRNVTCSLETVLIECAVQSVCRKCVKKFADVRAGSLSTV
jgi:ribosome-binding protein aMBF1 (putative translation factor)